MRSENEIKDRIDSIIEKLSVLSKKKCEEMKKPLRKRDHRLLIFIGKEYSMYNYALTELMWATS